MFLHNSIPNTEVNSNENDSKESKNRTSYTNDGEQLIGGDSNRKTVIGDDKVLSEKRINLDIGSYVIVKYSNELYPAKILNTDNDEWYCCAMRKSGLDRLNHWKWPDTPDLLWYNREDIVLKIKEPKIINTRGVCVVPELEALL